jgi:hypothetical protein
MLPFASVVSVRPQLVARIRRSAGRRSMCPKPRPRQSRECRSAGASASGGLGSRRHADVREGQHSDPDDVHRRSHGDTSNESSQIHAPLALRL